MTLPVFDSGLDQQGTVTKLQGTVTKDQHMLHGSLQGTTGDKALQGTVTNCTSPVVECQDINSDPFSFRGVEKSLFPASACDRNDWS